MSKPLRILILEDNPADAELVQCELREAGLSFTSKVVMTEGDFSRALREFSPDLILSDYDLPQYNGALALVESKRQCPDIPFILVTGAISEDRAIETLTNGAKDYVMKSRMNRLVPAVQRALTEAKEHKERKKAEEKLRKAHRNLETKVKKRTEALQAIVAEHKRVEEAYSHSERKYSLLHDTMLQGVVYQDAEGKIISMNPAAELILGKSPEEYLDHSLENNAEHHTLHSNGSLMPGLDHPSMVALRTGQELRDVVMGVYNPREKGYRWINVRAMPQFRPGEDKPYQVYIIFDDITERRRIEKTFQDSEVRYRRLFEAARDGILIVDAETGQIDDVNPFLLDMLNYSKEELIGKKLWEIGTFKDIEKSKFAFAELQNNRYIRYEDLQLETKDGRLIDVEFVSNVYQVDHTKVIQCNIRDITKRKRAERAVQNSERMYRAIGESIDYGVWVCSPDGRNIYVSESFLRLVGQTQEQCSNFGWGDVLHPDDAEKTIAAWKECVRTGCLWDIEHRFRGVDGQWHPILARGVPVRNEQGEIIYWAGINLDISKLKQAEMNLKEQTRQLEYTNKELDSFSYSVSHDLRAPLRAIEDIRG